MAMAMRGAVAILLKTGAPFLSSKLVSFPQRTFPRRRSFAIETEASSIQSQSSISVASNTSIPSGDGDADADADADAVLIKNVADVLDVRVGRILKAWKHPEADGLYIEEVDVGEEEPRTICSGLVKYIPLNHLQDLEVVVLANLKPRKMVGVASNGMLLAASDMLHENVELLLPAEGSVPGERIWFGSEEGKENQISAATPNQVQKKKYWESVQPHLKTDDSCIAVLGEHPMRSSAGLVTCRSLQGANIS